MAEFCRPWFALPDSDLIVPVPLHPRRLRWRGFNQAVLAGAGNQGGNGAFRLDPFVLIREGPIPQPQSGLEP